MLEYLPMVASAAGLVRVAAAVVLPGLSVGRVDAPPSPRLARARVGARVWVRGAARVGFGARVGVRVRVPAPRLVLRLLQLLLQLRRLVRVRVRVRVGVRVKVRGKG